MKRRLYFTVLIVAMIVTATNYTFGQIKIASGSEGATYYYLANDISKNSSQPIEVMTTMGSVENFNLLMDKNDVNIAFMQYDVLVANNLLNSKLKDQVRVLFPLFLDEEIHLITKKGSKIKNLKQLKGKKVGIGSFEQGTHVTAALIKDKTSIDWTNVEMPTNECYNALMSGEIDAYFFVGGIPVKSFSDMEDTTKIQLVNIKDKRLKDIYKAKTIKTGTYKWQTKNVSTYAVPMLIVVKIANMSNETETQVNQLLTDINANIQKMQAEGHPKWKDVYYRNQEIDWPYYYVRAKVE